MNDHREISLSRDCDAIQIPSGHPIVLPAGMNVIITQSLGGTYTVATPGGLARIELKDGDALGFDLHLNGPAVIAVAHVELSQRIDTNGAERTEVAVAVSKQHPDQERRELIAEALMRL